MAKPIIIKGKPATLFILCRLVLNYQSCDRTIMATATVSSEKKEIVKNLYVSGIPEEFIAIQLDLEIPIVIAILQEAGIYHHANEP